MFLNANSLYGTVLSQLLPIGEFFALPPEEVEKFDYRNTRVDGDFCYLERGMKVKKVHKV